MGGHQIDEEYRSDQMTSRKDGDPESLGIGGPPDNEAVEIDSLHLGDSGIHLSQGADENQYYRRRQADDGELQRGEKINKTVEHADQRFLRDEAAPIAGISQRRVSEIPRARWGR